MLSASQTILNWCVLVIAAALLGHLVHRFTGYPRMLGYTLVGLVGGWLGFGDLLWPLQGSTLLLLEVAVGVSLLLAASQLSLPWLLRQPWLILQSLGESLLTLALVGGVLRVLGWDWSVALAVGVVSMAASPAVLLRIADDLRASGAVTDRSLLLATISTLLALLGALVLTVVFLPVAAAAGGGLQFSSAGLGRLLLSVLFTLLWAALLTAAFWPVLRWQSSRSDTTALYLLAAMVAVCLLAQQWGGSAALAFMVAGLLLRNLSPRPLVWPQAFQAGNAMLNLLMFVLVASMAAQVGLSLALISVVASAVLARLVAKFSAILLLGNGTAIGWRRQWPVACGQIALSGVALLMVSALVQQWSVFNLGVAQQLAAIALPMIALCEVLGVLLAASALWRSGDAHRGVGRVALQRGEKRHDT
ncbi:cation:proton antiporter domain-containing protein [Comamonas suwonensis]|uniref:cation:proton antiporter domain-containing protein n=1 Tax=Comamonas suwonensis TaxID=2606214 RepID=UPI00145F7452|nr:cation:proton antiporter [Comamonas suwonensis]MBI1623839.1 cation:proton antiporter [Comamonas suwonensis]